MYNLTIEIMGIPIKIKDELDVIKTVGKFYNKTKARPKLNISFIKGKKKILKIKNNKMQFIAPSINFENPLQYAIVLQSIYRFLFKYLLKTQKPIVMLHASASFNKKNEIILFGDDNLGRGKSTFALLNAINSGYFLADEYCFLDINTNKVIGLHSPIHIRPDILNHIKTFGFEGPTDEQFGMFITKSKKFKKKKEGKLIYLIYPRASNKFSIKKLKYKKAYKNLISTILAHYRKMINPELDSMFYFDEIRGINKYISNKGLLNKISYLLEKIKKLASCVDSFELYYSKNFNYNKSLEVLRCLN